jgi:heptaprenyl diphosphate synthase
MEFLEVYQRHKPELQKVEDVLYASVQSRDPVLTQSAIQLLKAGGKRIRPLFALLSSRFGEVEREKVYVLAAALELVHMATLVHDDVIDDASVRRGQPTVKSQFGNRPAMYTGDFLFARAIHLLASLSNEQLHLELSEAIVRMCEGEIEQIRDFHIWQQSLRNYLRRIERKTALLISMSCSLGALISGVSVKNIQTLRRFGHHTGMAFQIIDDVLDYVGDESLVGKRLGSDLYQGNLTLPALYAATCGSDASVLQQLIRNDMTDTDVERSIGLIRRSDGVHYAKELAMRYLDKAIHGLDGMDDNPVREELIVVAQFVNQRLY